ncbi:aromatic ring-hydroxylating oxygenase subunit alpha [Pseudomonas faucium]|uniref:aromatic ring-hydroxylating oxygenase subunit alpha n=1 Tax=Pseudomonas faucium TaxID=2740518 RepID=UPI001F2B9377|nr:aromatic ring-hydroxylating dioxygenase subunit alpha [Pseudomonas faucium]
MIKPVLPPACYTEQSWFDREQREIFGKLWLLAGLTQQLAVDDSFITRNFSGTPVLVQNIKGELRAFRNACAHRGMPIQTAAHGVRKMVCPYHGWGYRQDGALRGIPNAGVYGLCKADKDEARLQRFALEVIGNFVFVNLNQDPLPITEQFSPQIRDVMTRSSVHFAADVSYAHFVNEYNWKLNFENILDWNHAQFVHPQTLAPLLNYTQEGTIARAQKETSLLFGGDEGARAASADVKDVVGGEDPFVSADLRLDQISFFGRSSMPYAPRWFSPLLASPCDMGAFFACNLFPNVNFGSIHGEHFYLQQYVPIAPGRIEYHSWVFTSRLKEHLPVQPHLLWGIHHAEKRVIDEDTVLLTELQKALKSADAVGVMGDHEAPLAAMGRWYMKALGECMQ